jgi:nucleoside-diphosphate-sugar epimerase
VRAAAGGRARIVRVPAPVTLVAALCCELAGRLRGRPLLLNRSRYAEIAAEGFVCSVDRLRDRLGVVAQIGLGEGLAKTAEWYRQEGWL